MNKFSGALIGAILLSPLASGAAVLTSDDIFNTTVNDINESVAKIVAAQAKRSRVPKIEAKAATCTPGQIDAAYKALPVCEAAIKKAFAADVRDFKGAINKGFSRGRYSLVLLTTTDAFFYHEDCDICAAVERCSLKDGSLSNFKTAHGVGCDDMAPLLKKDVAYSACSLIP